MCYVSFNLVSIPLSPPANYLIDSRGPYPSIVLGLIIASIGAWSRLLFKIDNSFYWILAGQLVAAVGQSFVINAPTAIAQRWFP